MSSLITSAAFGVYVGYTYTIINQTDDSIRVFLYGPNKQIKDVWASPNKPRKVQVGIKCIKKISAWRYLAYFGPSDKSIIEIPWTANWCRGRTVTITRINDQLTATLSP